MEAAVKGEIYALSSPRCAPKTVDYALVDHVTFHDRNGLGDQFAVVGNLHQPRGGNDQASGRLRAAQRVAGIAGRTPVHS